MSNIPFIENGGRKLNININLKINKTKRHKGFLWRLTENGGTLNTAAEAKKSS